MSAVPQEHVTAFRLRRHHLARRIPRADLEAVVRRTCGIQAQLASAAHLALWNRVADLRPADIAQALWSARSLVKVWCMRDALHLLAAEDYSLFLEGMMRRRLDRGERWFSKRGGDWPPEFQPLSKRELQDVTTRIGECVAEGPLTRQEVADRVTAQVGPKVRPWLEHGWGALIKQPCYAGLLVHGPDRGAKVTFVSPKVWLPGLPHVSPEEAEEALLRRYLGAYGPATPQDVGAWAGMPLRDLRPVWERIANALVRVTVDDREAWILEEDLETLEASEIDSPSVRLLSSFDVYLLGHKDKGHLVAPPHYKRVFRKAGWISPTLLVDGRVAGVWQQRRRKGQLHVTLEPFTRLREDVQSAVEGEVARLGEFADLPVELVFR